MTSEEIAIQPFKGNDVVIIERRREDGTLDMDGDQPPFYELKFDQVYRKMFWADPANNQAPGDPRLLRDWLKKKGWSLRAKTW